MLTEKPTVKDQTKQLILGTVKKQKPESVKQLIAYMRDRYAVPPQQTTHAILELENEKRTHLSSRQFSLSATSAKAFLLSRRAFWYWSIILLAIVTTLAIFIIPSSDYPIVYLRYALGFMFTLFLPGYTLVKLLFPVKLQKSDPLMDGNMEIDSKSMDKVEGIALSIGLSIALVAITDLILNAMPRGIALTPITLSLLSLAIIFASAAIRREYQITANAKLARSNNS